VLGANAATVGGLKLPQVGRGHLYLLICLLYLARTAGVPLLFWPTFALLASSILLSLLHLRRSALWLAILMGGVGLTIAGATGAALSDVAAGLLSTQGILAFIGLIQLMGKPIHIGGYGKAMVALFMRSFGSPRWLPVIGGLVTFTLTGAESIGSLPTTYYALEKGTAPGRGRQMLIRSLMFGQALGLIWAPTTAMFGIAVTLFSVDVPKLVLIALPAAGLALGASLYLHWRDAASMAIGPGLEVGAITAETYGKARTFLIVQVLMIGAIVGGQSLKLLPALDWILLVVLTSAFIWGLSVDRSAFLGAVRRYPSDLRALDANFSLFPLAGLLGVMLGRTSFGAIVGELSGLLPSGAWQLGGITAISFGLTLVGVYPAITVLILAPILHGSVDLSIEFLLLGLMMGGCVALPVTPASGVLQLGKAISGEPLDELRFGFSGRISLVCFAVGLAATMAVYLAF
jgi:hypothetical protein